MVTRSGFQLDRKAGLCGKESELSYDVEEQTQKALSQEGGSCAIVEKWECQTMIHTLCLGLP